MTKTYILTVFVYNGTVMIQHQSYAFSTEALAVKTKEALQKINKEKADKRLRIAYSIQEAPLYKVITDIPIFKDYQPTEAIQPTEATDAPAQPDNAPTQEPTDTAETSIADEEANAISTAASSTTELTTEAQEPATQEQTIQEQKPKSVRKITLKKTINKANKKK